MNTTTSRLVASAVVACAYFGLGVQAAHAQDPCPYFPPATECRPFGTQIIPPNTYYILENNAWSDPGQCIRWIPSDGRFCVSYVPPPAPGLRNVGFPNLLQGQVFKTGPTTGWVPRQVSAITDWGLGWQNSNPYAPGSWQAIVELWAHMEDPTGKMIDQPNGTELIIWFGSSGTIPGPGTITGHALIDGLYWDVYAGRWPPDRDPPPPFLWNYIAYVPANPGWDYASLYGDVTPFLLDAQHQTGVGTGDSLGPCVDSTAGNNQCLDSSWWITSIQAGFEVFSSDAVGLVANNFRSVPGANGGCAQRSCLAAALGM